MAHLELQLISNIIAEGDMNEIRKRRVTPELFCTEEAFTVFEWIWDQYHHPSHRGEVPSKSRLLRAFPEFDYCPATDSIGALISELKQNKVRIDMREISSDMEEYLDDGTDPLLVLEAFMPKLRDLSATGVESQGLLMANAADVLLQEYRTVKAAGGITGVPYPWAPMNKATGGMHEEEFIVLYGRPGNMKTWCALAIAAYAYKYANKRVLVYSKEMSQTQLARRTASILAEVDYAHLMEGRLTDEAFERFKDTLENLKSDEEANQRGSQRRAITFENDQNLKQGSTVDGIAVLCERFDPDLVIVDGAYHLRDSRTKSKTVDWKNIAHVAQDLKTLAQSLQIPLIATAQANRAAAAGRGNDVTEIANTDSFGQEASVAMRCFRGRGPDGKSAVLMNFSKVREARLGPFLINAIPGLDFSLLQSSVNVTAFLKDKATMEDEERGADGTSKTSGATTGPGSTSSSPKRKQRRKKKRTLFRD